MNKFLKTLGILVVVTFALIAAGGQEPKKAEAATSTITVFVNATPNSSTNFLFSLTRQNQYGQQSLLTSFYLRDNQYKTTSVVTPGFFTIRNHGPTNWYVTSIQCYTGGQLFDTNTSDRDISVYLPAGYNTTCIFNVAPVSFGSSTKSSGNGGLSVRY